MDGHAAVRAGDPGATLEPGPIEESWEVADDEDPALSKGFSGCGELEVAHHG